jgi:hypothetical protein
MQKKKLVKSALMLTASIGLLLTQGCDEEDVPGFLISPWTPVIRTVSAVNANASANTGTGGQAGNNSAQTQNLSGVARTGISGNQVAGGGVP